MIDERSLLNWLRNYQFENYAEVGHEKEYNFIENLIKGIENEPKVGEWIPCSKEFPKELSYILVCTDEDEVFLATYLGTLNDGSHCFDDDDGMMWDGDVVAWMPLPEPYKE